MSVSTGLWMVTIFASGIPRTLIAWLLPAIEMTIKRSTRLRRGRINREGYSFPLIGDDASGTHEAARKEAVELRGDTAIQMDDGGPGNSSDQSSEPIGRRELALKEVSSHFPRQREAGTTRGLPFLGAEMTCGEGIGDAGLQELGRL